MSSLPYGSPCNCIDRSYFTLIAAGFGLVRMNSTDLYVWDSTVVTFMRITYLRFNILFPVLGYDDVSETNLRSYSVHSAKHVQENRPVPIRRKRSIGKKTAICTWGVKTGGAFGQPRRTFHWKNVTCTKEKKAISSFCLFFLHKTSRCLRSCILEDVHRRQTSTNSLHSLSCCSMLES